MQHINRILVGLDLTEMDRNLIQHTAFICQLTGATTVSFFHIEKDLEHLHELFPELTNSNRPADETVQGMMEQEVSKVFSSIPEVETTCTVVEGAPLKQLAHWAKVKEADLILVGQKKTLKGSGVVPRKLARVSRCNILFVPENAQPKLQRMLVPIDFSEHSKLALEHAVFIAQHLEQPEIIVQHIYEIPPGHYRIGEKKEEISRRIRKLTESKMFAEISSVPHENVPLQTVLTEADEDDSDNLILKACKEKQVDMLVIGAKGQTAVSAFLLGSFTEKLLSHSPELPVLIIKRKDEELGFLDSIMFDKR